jgi:hypothetical protein
MMAGELDFSETKHKVLVIIPQIKNNFSKFALCLIMNLLAHVGIFATSATLLKAV